jgi:hypothetical protein
MIETNPHRWNTFEKRHHIHGKYSIYWNQIVIIINKNGDILLTDAVFKALGEPKHVELLYDAGGRHVGIRAVDYELSPNTAYTVQTAKRAKKGALAGKVSASSFTAERHLVRTDDKSSVFKAALNKADGVISFNCDQMASVV